MILISFPLFVRIFATWPLEGRQVESIRILEVNSNVANQEKAKGGMSGNCVTLRFATQIMLMWYVLVHFVRWYFMSLFCNLWNWLFISYYAYWESIDG